MSFAQLYAQQRPQIPAQKGTTAIVMISTLRNHTDRWNGPGWAMDAEDDNGNAAVIASPFERKDRDGGPSKPLGWVLLKTLRTILDGRLPDPSKFITDPNAAFSETSIHPDASALVRGAVVEIRCTYKGKDWTPSGGGETRPGDCEWQVERFVEWHEADNIDATEDADPSPPQGGYGYATPPAAPPTTGGGYGHQGGYSQPQGKPYADDADIPF